MEEAVMPSEPLINSVRAALITRRAELLLWANATTTNERELVEIIRSLLLEIVDLEDYKRRVDFSMQCMEGDAKGFLGKILAVRNGQPSRTGLDGFEKAPTDDE